VGLAIAFLDVDYRDDHAFAACVLADAWDAPAPRRELAVRVDGVAPYEPGSFYKRELPCLLAVLAAAGEPLACAVVDGYVRLDRDGRPGLGARLHEALGGATPVVGVAKKRFGDGAFAERVLRGGSATPLWVTAAGLSDAEAAAHVRAMHGPYRVPTLLTRADRLCRDAR
jgi:deoxyribonuclease V